MSTGRHAGSGSRVAARVVLALAGVAALVGSGLGPAAALPPGGAGSSTPGTSSTVSPTRLSAGDTIRFTLRGFPAGETVNVKIDDGAGYSDQTIQGSGVVYQQKIAAGGTVSGSFALPAKLSAGRHWLRFLASEEFTDAKGNLGVKGYTNRSPEFTVVAATTSGSTGGKTSGGKTTTGSSKGSQDATGGRDGAPDAASRGESATSGSEQGADAGDESAAAEPGAVVTARPRIEASTAPATAAPTTSPTMSPTAEQTLGTAAPALAATDPSTGSQTPVLGLGALAGVVVLGGLGAWLALRRPRGAPRGASRGARPPAGGA
ncbi:hypothetical protein [Cellulomonas sp. HZM]|uniref:hypothetical protein n=1 Tax=Cellulomonas sp. HZM TaxID=1454010 RepID=UPI00068F0F78|nr:hypothetical protein [Cellulomonas sp. HZM]